MMPTAKDYVPLPDGRWKRKDTLKPEELQALQSEAARVVEVKRERERVDQMPEIKELARLLAPYWGNHQGHNLALSVSGFLAKMGWASPVVKELIKEASLEASDEELKDRLCAVDTTFQKRRADLPIRGYAGLEEILPQTTLEQVEEIAKSAKIPPLVRKVDAIRLDAKTPAFLKKRGIAEVVIGELRGKGKFLSTAGGELFYFSGELMSLDSPKCKAFLDKTFGLNCTEQEGKYVMAALETEALQVGDRVEVYRVAHWDRDKGYLYIDSYNRNILSLDGEDIKSIPNGSDGVYFASEGWQQPFEPDLVNPLTPWEYLTDDLSFEVGNLVALSPEKQKIVAKLLTLSLFFPEEMPTKPIYCITGDKGAGKSFFLRRLMRFLYGVGDVSGVGEKDDFRASLSANHFLAIDDVEKGNVPHWFIPELKRAATGQEIALRRLYTTNTEVRFTPRCFVAFTSINPPVDDAALADRLIILRLSRRNSFSPEGAVLHNLKKLRNSLWGGLLNELNSLIPEVHKPTADVDFRLADWASLCWRLIGDEMDRILKGLASFQNEAIFESSPIPAILEIWQAGRGEWLTTPQLYDEWKTLAQDRGLWFPYKSPRALAMHLTNIKHNLATAYGVKWQTKRPGEPATYFFRAS